MYMLGAQGRHKGPGVTEDDACENLVDGLIHDIGGIQPAKAALIALLSMRPSERTQGWFPKEFRARHATPRGATKKGQDVPGPRRTTGNGCGHMSGQMPGRAPKRHERIAPLRKKRRTSTRVN